MAQQVEFGRGAIAKVRSFWVGLGLSVITLGIYYYVWYYMLNDELKDIGIAKDDPNLAQSSPTNSVIAVTLGSLIFVPSVISVYNFGARIKRAQRLVGIEASETINPTLAILLLFPGAILIVPAFAHYWYVTKHQNAAVLGAAGLAPGGEAVAPFSTADIGI
jgi:hypothetical protein